MILWLSANNSKKTLHNSPVRVRYGVSFGSSKSGLHHALVIVTTYYVDHIITNIIMVRSHHIWQDTSWCQILFGTKPQHFKQKTAHNLHRLTVGWISTVSTLQSIVRTVPLLKPPQIPHCNLGAVDHAKKFPPPLVTLQAQSYRAHRATQTLYRAHRSTQTLLFSSPLISLRCVTEIKFAQNLRWLWNWHWNCHFQHIAYRIESQMEFLGPILAKLY